MKTLSLDTGMTEYRLGSGVLRCNPSDPNLYARFLEALDGLRQLETRLANPVALPRRLCCRKRTGKPRHC